MVHHLLPVVLEDICTPTARLVADSPIRLWADDDASRTSVLAPAIHAPKEGFVLPGGKSTRELDTELLKDLHRVDVGKRF
jgi:hypothetical protein